MNNYTGFTTKCKICGKDVESVYIRTKNGIRTFKLVCDCSLPDRTPCIHPCENCGRINAIRK